MSPLQFFIISVVTVMVQSAPVKRDTCNEASKKTLLIEAAATRTDVENKTVILLCAAQSVQNTTARLKERLNRATVLDVSDINNNNKEVINKTFNHFSSICQDFTLAMSLQHQLQDYLLNQSNQNVTDEDIKQLSSLLVALQTMSNILDQLQFYNNSSNCPRLSSTEYKMMYQVQYTTTYNNNIESLLKPIEMWSHKNNYETGTKPDPCNCKVLKLFTAN